MVATAFAATLEPLTWVNDCLQLMHELIDAVRGFNRFSARVNGVLNQQHPGLTPGQSRVLFEVGQLAPIEAHALQAHLDLDAGYLSRRLSELESMGLVKRGAGSTARTKRVTLSAKGRQRLARLEAASNSAAKKLVARLMPAQQHRLRAAMLEVQQLLDGGVEIEPEAADSSDARACLAAYFAELERRFPGGFDPGATVSADPDEVTPPRGQFLLVRVDGRPRGCGAVKSLGGGIGELKRMWLHPQLRGHGLGRRLLRALEDKARMLGFHTLRLDTSAHLEEALALYRGAGYREIRAYNDNRYAAHWFEKRLAPQGMKKNATARIR